MIHQANPSGQLLLMRPPDGQNCWSQAWRQHSMHHQHQDASAPPFLQHRRPHVPQAQTIVQHTPGEQQHYGPASHQAAAGLVIQPQEQQQPSPPTQQSPPEDACAITPVDAAAAFDASVTVGQSTPQQQEHCSHSTPPALARLQRLQALQQLLDKLQSQQQQQQQQQQYDGDLAAAPAVAAADSHLRSVPCSEALGALPGPSTAKALLGLMLRKALAKAQEACHYATAKAQAAAELEAQGNCDAIMACMAAMADGAAAAAKERVMLVDLLLQKHTLQQRLFTQLQQQRLAAAARQGLPILLEGYRVHPEVSLPHTPATVDTEADSPNTAAAAAAEPAAAAAKQGKPTAGRKRHSSCHKAAPAAAAGGVHQTAAPAKRQRLGTHHHLSCQSGNNTAAEAAVTPATAAAAAAAAAGVPTPDDSDDDLSMSYSGSSGGVVDSDSDDSSRQ